MAEGFAKRYGSDVMEVKSAGLSPAPIVQPLTFQMMEEKNIKLDGQCPKDLSTILISEFDLLVNMSGVRLPSRIPLTVREWKIEDPIGRSEEVYREVRDQIEDLVMQLILEFRRDLRPKTKESPSTGFARLGRRPR
jgi:arsenate reductase (thioredoxin)